MTTAADYRRYARECIDSANDALTEPVRQQFLDLATLWLTAAERMETRPGPLPQNQITLTVRERRDRAVENEPCK
jgi:hypothetical protein